jgi:isoquinoline 1-oxidoreductase beta subunit
MPMLIAEELNVDIRAIKVSIAPPNQKLYGNALLGGPQLTGGSSSVRDGWEKLRIAGAQVRMMLISAAAQKWNIPESQLRAENGRVIGPKGRKATYGQLAAAASKLPVPDKVVLKDPKDFKIVGKPTRRLDTPSKVNGTAEFGIDVKLPGMVYASLEQCPVIGGTVKSFDASKAKTMPGVIDVVQIPDGIAIVADTWWHARKAREGLTVVWDEGAGAALTEKTMLASTKAAGLSDAAKPLALPKVGDADAVIKGAAKVIKAEYTMPLLSHSSL